MVIFGWYIPYELLMVAFLAGLLTPVFASDWGKCATIGLGIVIVGVVVWAITGKLDIAMCCLAYSLGFEVGFKIRKRRLVIKLREAVLAQERLCGR
jgi:uncharacterized membrane protein YjjP (DUF1212 family)